MTGEDLIITGEPASAEPDLLKIYGSIFDAGQRAGRESAGKDEVLDQVVDAALTGLLDEGSPEHVREKIFANIVGFATGWAEMMAIQPMMFLTRQQTWKVQHMTRGMRQAWLSEYKRGLKHWRAKGGSLGGRRPVLPALPDEEPTAPEPSRIVLP
jgi:hypothetical protein